MILVTKIDKAFQVLHKNKLLYKKLADSFYATNIVKAVISFKSNSFKLSVQLEGHIITFIPKVFNQTFGWKLPSSHRRRLTVGTDCRWGYHLLSSIPNHNYLTYSHHV